MNPEKIGRYEVKSELGRGGMATVYHAYDPRFEREVAIKVLPRELLHDPQFRIRFEREAKTIAKLDHPAIVPVYDFGEEGGQPYYVMRYMPGGSLSERMNRGPLSITETNRILVQLAPALDLAHKKGIVHRDLKPGNILFDQENQPFVSDFGIVKIAEAKTTITGTAVVGTPAYMSPEQAQGEPIDGRSDIYTLGVILFEMLCGRPPFDADTPMGIAIKHITEPVPNILEFDPSLPYAIHALIEKAMAKNRDERFATVGEMAAALSAIARGETPNLKTSAVATRLALSKTKIAKRAAAPTVRAAAPPGKKKNRLWAFLGVTAFLLITIGVVSVLLLRDQLPFFPGANPNSPIQGTTLTSDTALPTSDVAASGGTPAASPTQTPPGSPVIGGADMIAFLNDNDIWTINVDGSDPQQITTDGTSKQNLQWLPDGENILYITGKCIQIANIHSRQTETLTCFVAAEYLDAFEISPDGALVAISLNREVYAVPLDLERLSSTRSYMDLASMNGCYIYTKVGAKDVRWSSDNKKLAVEILGVERGQTADMIRVIDIQRCVDAEFSTMDTFPAARFEMNGYGDKPIIPSFDWDGGQLFLLNSHIRNDGYGFLYTYNLESLRGRMLEPVGSCCYRDPQWSPDGTHILFAFQSLTGTTPVTQLYYLSYGTLGTGVVYEPIRLPEGFFTNPREQPQPVPRPAR